LESSEDAHIQTYGECGEERMNERQLKVSKITEHMRDGTLRIEDFLNEFVAELKEQLRSDYLRWGDTWLHSAETPVPWLKIVGGALICWIREQHPELFPGLTEEETKRVGKELQEMGYMGFDSLKAPLNTLEHVSEDSCPDCDLPDIEVDLSDVKVVEKIDQHLAELEEKEREDENADKVETVVYHTTKSDDKNKREPGTPDLCEERDRKPNSGLRPIYGIGIWRSKLNNQIRGEGKMTREEVYKLIDGEREYQKKLEEMSPETFPLPIAGELVLLRKYLRDAENIYAETFGDPKEQPTMDIIRKLAAICVRAMEGNGAPARDIEGSLARRQL